MIVANGCPKSGTHALMSLLAMSGGKRVPGILDGRRRLAVSLRPTEAWPNVSPLSEAAALPHSYFIHGHVPADAELPHREKIKVITIIRDPRSVLVSYARWKGKSNLVAILRSEFFGCDFVELYRSFLGWRDRGLVIRYEDMPRDFTDGAPDLYEGALVDHSTLEVVPSDWRQWWTPRVERFWSTVGGEALVREAGYA